MSIISLQDALYDWVVTIFTAGQIIWLDSNVAQPEKKPDPYVGLRINNYTQVHREHVSSPDNTGNAAIYVNEDFELEVNAYGENAFQIVEDIKYSLNKSTVWSPLAILGIAVVDNNQPTLDLSFLEDSRWEARAQNTFRFRTHRAENDEVGVIESVEISESYEDETGTERVSDIYIIDSTT